MADPVIEVENLGKKYIIDHQSQTNSRYVALRDVLTDRIRSVGRRFQSGAPDPRARTSRKEEFWALKQVSFQVQQGEVVGIIGRNGAGKSTLLKLLSRITQPTTGTIHLRGRVASLLEVGTGFHPELTGRENIFLNGAILGMSRAEIKSKFDEIVAFAEVDRFLDTPVKRYSSGMYVRLAFAVAAHLEPEILIVDEVLAVGDAEFQKKCLGKMGDVGKEGRTVLFVSHNIEAIRQLCNTVILLNEGNLELVGSKTQVINTYLKSNLGTTSHRKWLNIDKLPGDEFVRLTEVKVHDSNYQVCEDFNITEPIGFTLTYMVLKSGELLTHSINLFNDSGIHILSSHDITSCYIDRPREKGNYSSTMWVPGNFLAEGRLTASVAIIRQDPFKIYFHELDAVTFNIFDPMDGTSARGKCLMPIPGVVRPLLNWETTKQISDNA
jgi:lipopolysaccharide transport system ATP-binding protein